MGFINLSPPIHQHTFHSIAVVEIHPLGFFPHLNISPLVEIVTGSRSHQEGESSWAINGGIQRRSIWRKSISTFLRIHVAADRFKIIQFIIGYGCGTIFHITSDHDNGLLQPGVQIHDIGFEYKENIWENATFPTSLSARLESKGMNNISFVVSSDRNASNSFPFSVAWP